MYKYVFVECTALYFEYFSIIDRSHWISFKFSRSGGKEQLFYANGKYPSSSLGSFLCAYSFFGPSRALLYCPGLPIPLISLYHSKEG